MSRIILFSSAEWWSQSAVRKKKHIIIDIQEYSWTLIIWTSTIQISQLLGLFLWFQFFHEYLLVMIKICSPFLFKTTALESEVKAKFLFKTNWLTSYIVGSGSQPHPLWKQLTSSGVYSPNQKRYCFKLWFVQSSVLHMLWHFQ